MFLDHRTKKKKILHKKIYISFILVHILYYINLYYIIRSIYTYLYKYIHI